MDFRCVGYDVRIWPWSGSYSADLTGWERCDQRFEDLMELGFWQNEYQLFELDFRRLTRVLELVRQWNDCRLVAIEYPEDIISLRDERLKVKTSVELVDKNKFEFLGLDVCDVSALVSVIHHPVVASRMGGEYLFGSNDEFAALELVQFANFLDPDHSPFAVSRLWALKSEGQ